MEDLIGKKVKIINNDDGAHYLEINSTGIIEDYICWNLYLVKSDSQKTNDGIDCLQQILIPQEFEIID